MKRTAKFFAAAVAVGALMVAGLSLAQQPGTGYGPGYGMGYGMGPGTMGSYVPGGYGMGPGMMWGYGGDAYAGLDLNPEQRQKIADIQEQTASTMWQLMGTMHQQGYHRYGMFGSRTLDEQAARQAYETMAGARQAMFEVQLDARKKMDAVLTPEQRDQLRRSWSGR